MTRRDGERARRFSDVLMSIRAARDNGIGGPTAVQIAGFMVWKRNPRSVAGTLRHMQGRDLVWSNHSQAQEILESCADLGVKPSDWVLRELREPNQYYLTAAGHLAADMLEVV